MAGRAQLLRWAPAWAVGLVAVLWGVTFTLTARTLTALPADVVVLLRFGLAAAVIAMVGRARPLPPSLRWRGVVLGGLLGAGFLLQTRGLLTTDPMTSGMLTGLLVIVAPALETVLFGRRHRSHTWIAVALACLGLLLLTVRPSGVGRGELLTVGAATVWALHLVLTSRWSRSEHALGLARLQTSVVAVLAALVWAWDRPSQPTSASGVPVGAWLLVGLVAVVCTALPMVLLTWGQARLDATRSAVILTAEPAVAALTAAVTGVPIGVGMVAGGGLVIAAMVLAQSGQVRIGQAADPTQTNYRGVVVIRPPAQALFTSRNPALHEAAREVQPTQKPRSPQSPK